MAIQKDLYFFDFSKKEDLLTTKNDVPVITNEESVLESIKNILMTRPGERVMNPEFGVNLDRFLFQPMEMWYAARIADEIKTGLMRFEPRLSRVEVEIDLNYDENFYDIRIVFSIASAARQFQLNFQLNQIR